MGVFYGFSHQRSITATQKAQHDKHEYEEKQKKIQQAKAEYAKQKSPAPASTNDGTLAARIAGLSNDFGVLKGHPCQTSIAGTMY